MTIITVALVEDNPDTRARFAQAINASPELQLLFEADTAQAMLDWLAKRTPQVLLVDLGLPDKSGIEVIRFAAARYPACNIMVISMFGDEHNVLASIEAGASGYLLKDGLNSDISAHIRDLHAGGSPMTPTIARKVLMRMQSSAAARKPAPSIKNKNPDGVSALTPRECEILTLIARGFSYAEVASILTLSVHTIHDHIKHIYGKLAVHSKSEALFEARQLGLLD